jgi:hypothetical protein
MTQNVREGNRVWERGVWERGVWERGVGMESKPSDLAWSPNLQIWHGVQTFRFGMESKPSDLACSPNLPFSG